MSGSRPLSDQEISDDLVKRYKDIEALLAKKNTPSDFAGKEKEVFLREKYALYLMSSTDASNKERSYANKLYLYYRVKPHDEEARNNKEKSKFEFYYYMGDPKAEFLVDLNYGRDQVRLNFLLNFIDKFNSSKNNLINEEIEFNQRLAIFKFLSKQHPNSSLSVDIKAAQNIYKIAHQYFSRMENRIRKWACDDWETAKCKIVKFCENVAYRARKKAMCEKQSNEVAEEIFDKVYEDNYYICSNAYAYQVGIAISSLSVSQNVPQSGKLTLSDSSLSSEQISVVSGSEGSSSVRSSSSLLPSVVLGVPSFWNNPNNLHYFDNKRKRTLPVDPDSEQPLDLKRQNSRA